MSFKLNGNTWDLNATVQAGQAQDIFLPNRGASLSIAVQPGAGGSVGVQFCVCAPDVAKSGSAVWIPWQHGAVSAAAGLDSDKPTTAFRVTAVGADAVVQISQGAR